MFDLCEGLYYLFHVLIQWTAILCQKCKECVFFLIPYGAILQRFYLLRKTNINLPDIKRLQTDSSILHTLKTTLKRVFIIKSLKTLKPNKREKETTETKQQNKH
jgi:hypothetical protein